MTSTQIASAPDTQSQTFDGAVHLPGDLRYDELRQPFFPAFDPHPAMVVEAFGPADVQHAVITAREQDLPLAVQATGHGTHVPSDGGVLLRTSNMARVLVDPDRRIARVGPGARWSGVLAAAAPFGLAPLSGSAPSVGVTGYTLGGGVGWLSRKHGFAADSVLKAELVTADGSLVTASADQHADIFWALKGGSGNFGVVTALEFRLYPVRQVYAGISYFDIERAADVLARYREWTTTAPDELSTAVVLTRIPDTEQRALAIKVMYTGEAEEAERLLAPLREAAGPALVDGYETMRYADARMGGTPARHLDLFRELPDQVVDTLVDASEEATVEVRHWGGAMANPAPDAGPAGHRDVPYSVIVDAKPRELVEALKPHATGGSFLNFLSDTSRTETAYAQANYRRLAEVKWSYDPENVFRLNHNISPAPPGVARINRSVDARSD
jgi:FAD/FMN-containing dehydrogenase